MIDTFRHNFGKPSNKYVLTRVDQNQNVASSRPDLFARKAKAERICCFILESRSRRIGCFAIRERIAADRDLFSNVEADEKVVRC